ncbi:MAG: hypothetical protein QM731_04745 [Chitinophagaceae bacterium]
MTTCDNITNLSSSQVTRVKLLGTGVVCGLEVFRDTQCFISLTKGVGVTSVGHVICLPDKTFKYYREYTAGADYFNSLINCKPGTQQTVTVYELLENRQEGATSIVPQDVASIEKPFLEGKVVLLYLEDEVKMVVKVLLIDELDMWAILKCKGILRTHCIQTEPLEEEDISIFDKEQEDSLPGEEELYNAVNKKYLIRAIAIRRFGYGGIDIGDLYPEDAEEKNLNPNFSFDSQDEFFKEYELLVDDALDKLDKGIDRLHNHFGCMIDACSCNEKEEDKESRSPCNPLNPDTQADTGLQVHNIKIFDSYFTLINKKWSVYKRNGAPIESVQYFYDFVRDLVKTFNELVFELQDLVDECCPDTDLFPRHLMLGRIKEDVTFQPSIFRHYYQQPPVYNDNADRLQKVRLLHWRMVIMMKCFYIPDWELDDLSDESYYDVLAMENEKKAADDQTDYLPVRITPGRLFSEALGKQAIPFYYNLSNSPYSLQYYWDYKAVKHNREDHLLSYFSKEPTGYTNRDFVVNPFVFSLDQYPFYRIEGHTGMKADDAVAAIKNLRRRFALSFDIVVATFADLKKLFDVNNTEDIPAYGLEHVGGVQKGYTFILLCDENSEGRIIVGDFQVPFMVFNNVKKDNSNPNTPSPTDNTREIEAKWQAIQQKVGAATRADALQQTGMNELMEKRFKQMGIASYEQVSKLTPDDIPVLAAKMQVKEAEISAVWFTNAKSFISVIVAPQTDAEKWKVIQDRVGVATKADSLQQIAGVTAAMEASLQKAGLKSYDQIAKLTREDIPVLAKTLNVEEKAINEEWFKTAAELAKRSVKEIGSGTQGPLKKDKPDTGNTNKTKKRPDK